MVYEKPSIKKSTSPVSKTNYSFARKDGSVVNGKYSNAYLPAVPILLLR